MTNEEIIDLTKMDKDEICHIKCKQRKQLQASLEKEKRVRMLAENGNKELLKENKILRECVEFYADNNPKTREFNGNSIVMCGKLARKTLAKIKGEV